MAVHINNRVGEVFNMIVLTQMCPTSSLELVPHVYLIMSLANYACLS